MNNNLLILCEGTYGSVVKEIADALKCYEQITVLTSRYGTEANDANYNEIGEGNINDYEKYAGKYTYGIAVFEDAKERLDWTQKLVDEGFKIISLVSPQAYVSPSAQIENGCVIEALAGVGANVIVGSCSIIKMGALIDHDSILAKGCLCENYCVVKTGAYVQPCRTISRYSVINSLEEEQKIRDEYN